MTHTPPTLSPQRSQPAAHHRWLWHIFVFGTVLSILVVSGSALLLGLGVGNPKRTSNLIWIDDQLSWAEGPKPLTIDNDQTLIFTSPELLPLQTFSLEITGKIEEESDDLVAWGIWIETSRHDWLIIAINGAQFVTARLCPTHTSAKLETCQPLLEPNQQIQTVWKTFHHIRPIGQTNHIQLDYLPDQWTHGLTLRLNDEWMWDIPYTAPTTQPQWGIWMRGGSEESSKIRWINTKIWQD